MQFYGAVKTVKLSLKALKAFLVISLFRLNAFLKNFAFFMLIASAITYGFATVGKANVQKALLFVTALLLIYWR